MKYDGTKKIVLYILASTGAVLFLLAIYRIFINNNPIYGVNILQIVGANIVITIGLNLTEKIESRYAIFEILIDIGFMTVVIVLFGVLFKWYNNVPIWFTVIMVVVIYISFYLLDIIRVRKDIEEINELLKKNKEKKTDTAS